MPYIVLKLYYQVVVRSVADAPKSRKYQQVFDYLANEIRSGKYRAGQKLPSEAALVQQFHTSRITVGRALRELTAQGLVGRVAGSGTFVKEIPTHLGAMLFGLLIPNLGESEIFEPICQGMAGSPQAADHGLLWGHADVGSADREQQALQLCRQYIARKVDGVFFAPLERTPEKDKTNRMLLELLDQAHIPVVLLDRHALPFPQRTPHDLVGIDNRRAGYLATMHLLEAGCQHIVFLALAGAAPTVDARLAGYREAMLAHCGAASPGALECVESVNTPVIRDVVERTRADAFVCANDRTAGLLMHSLLALDCRVPADIRIVGMDDVEYASLLPVPLTTIRQPCREIGEAAMGVMLERIQNPRRIARDVLLDCQLIVRRSSGTV